MTKKRKLLEFGYKLVHDYYRGEFYSIEKKRKEKRVELSYIKGGELFVVSLSFNDMLEKYGFAV